MSLKPATINFTIGNGLAIYKGSNWFVSVGVEEDNMPYDLTGYRGKCSIKLHTGDAVPLLEPDVIIEGSNFSLNLTSDQTATLPTDGQSHYEISTYQYDVYFIDENDEYFRTLQGFVDVSPTVTEEDD